MITDGDTGSNIYAWEPNEKYFLFGLGELAKCCLFKFVARSLPKKKTVFAYLHMPLKDHLKDVHRLKGLLPAQAHVCPSDAFFFSSLPFLQFILTSSLSLPIFESRVMVRRDRL